MVQHKALVSSLPTQSKVNFMGLDAAPDEESMVVMAEGRAL